MNWKEFLNANGWVFTKSCGICTGCTEQYEKREYWVKICGGRFKLYHKGTRTTVKPLGNLEETIKDI